MKHSKTQTSIGLSSYKPMNIMNYKTTKTMNKNESLAVSSAVSNELWFRSCNKPLRIARLKFVNKNNK